MSIRVYAEDGTSLTANAIKNIILYADFDVAWYTLSKYVTKRKLLRVHENIIKHMTSSPSTVDLAPRGFGKSTIGDVDYCITKILREPDIRILIGSKTQAQAEAFLKEVRAHFEGNEDLIKIFGSMVGPIWKDKEFIVSTRKKIIKEATLTALGASGAVVSKHFDVIIADDLVGFENARTETQREKLMEWFYSSFLPTLEPEGEFHALGTRYHPLDLYQNLIDSGNYSVQIQRALEKRVKDGKTQVKSLWGDKFTTEVLRKKEIESGKIIFAMQYQNDVELAKGSIFKYEYFQYYDEYQVGDGGQVFVLGRDKYGEKYKKPVTVYIGVDLAISEKETADFFVLMVIGIDEDKNVYVLEYIQDRMTFDRQINTIMRYGIEKWDMVARLAVESNAYQAAMASELRRTTTLPIMDIKTHKDKVTRAMRRSALFENRKVFFRDTMGDLEECLILFPDGTHDDLFDGLDFAIQASEKGRIRVIDRSLFNV